MFNSRSDIILPHKKSTWTDLGVYIPIYPRRYAPEAKHYKLISEIAYLFGKITPVNGG